MNIGLSLCTATRVQTETAINIPQDITKVNTRDSILTSEVVRPGGSGSAEGSDPLLYLYSNNCTGNTLDDGQATSNESQKLQAITALSSLLSPYHKKAAQTLFLNVQRLIEKEAATVDHVGFLTLTFPDSVVSNKEASRRFHSFRTHYLSKHPAFGKWVNTKERQKKRGEKEGNAGSWHYHLIVTLDGDIRSGVNWDELAQGNYQSASPYLRSIWKDLRENLKKYGFGRSELLPVRTNAEMMARYVGKYISKHLGQREEEDKGVRLVSYSGDWVKNSAKFAWNTKNAHEWRRKLAKFAEMLGCTEMYQLSEKLGPGWVYKYLDDIMAIDQTCFEKAFNDHHEKRETIIPEFQSNVIKKVKQNQKQKLIVEKDQKEKDSTRRAVAKKKEETKIYMSKLKKEYVENWLSENNNEDSLTEILQETYAVGERYQMKKRQFTVGEYCSEQTIFIHEKTGEITPF